MLDGGTDSLRLHSFDVADSDIGGEEGIFSEILEVTAVAGRAVDVYTRAEHVMDAARASVASDAATNATGQIRVPRGGKPDTSSVSSRGETSIAAGAKGAVGHLKCRQA